MKVLFKILFQVIFFSSLINLIASEYLEDNNTTNTTNTTTTTTPTTTPITTTIYPEELNCLLTQPIKDIKDDCYDENIDERRKCCYVEVKFKYNTYISCIVIDIESENIRGKINNLTKIYKVDSKSIKIDCNKSFIKLSLIFVILFFII